MKDKKDELTPEQLEKIAGGVSSYSSSSSGYTPSRFRSSSSSGSPGTRPSSSSSTR